MENSRGCGGTIRVSVTIPFLDFLEVHGLVITRPDFVDPQEPIAVCIRQFRVDLKLPGTHRELIPVATTNVMSAKADIAASSDIVDNQNSRTQVHHELTFCRVLLCSIKQIGALRTNTPTSAELPRETVDHCCIES